MDKQCFIWLENSGSQSSYPTREEGAGLLIHQTPLWDSRELFPGGMNSLGAPVCTGEGRTVTRVWRNLCLYAQSCLTLCNPMDCGPLDSSVLGILQPRILEWVAMPPSRGSS